MEQRGNRTPCAKSSRGQAIGNHPNQSPISGWRAKKPKSAVWIWDFGVFVGFGFWISDFGLVSVVYLAPPLDFGFCNFAHASILHMPDYSDSGRQIISNICINTYMDI